MKKKRQITIKLLFFFLFASLIFHFCKPVVKFKKPPVISSSESKIASNKKPVPQLKAIKVSPQNILMPIEFPARLSAYKIAQIRPQVDGIIKERFFEEGSFVKENDQLYQIDPTIYQANLEKAAANLQTIKAKKTRYESLLEMQAISQQEFDDILANFKQAEANLSQAQANLDYTKVYAPISGYIGKSNVTQGALVSVNQNQILTTITQLDPIYVDISVPVKDLALFRNQNELLIKINIDGVEYKHDGILKFSEVFVDEINDSVLMRAQFINPDAKLLAGMFVTAKIYVKKDNVISIPQRVTNRDITGNLRVWLINDKNQLMPRLIKAGRSFQDKWIINQGLKEGDIILYEGFQKIAPQMVIKPVFDKSISN